VTNVNEAASRLLGVAQVGGDSSPLAPADAAVRASLERMRDHVLAGHGVYQARGLEEAVCVRDEGGERTLLPGAAPVYGEGGEVAGAAVVLRDVTRLRRADELKNDLVAFVAHEFRTPLTSLQMAIHLCAEQVVGPLTEKQADLMFAARQDCERLTDIVEDLLDVSSMQEGELGLNRVPIAAEALAQAAVDSHAEEAAAKEVSLKSELLPDTGEVLADAERVRLIFDNLVGNAIRFAPKGGEVFLRGRREEAFVRFEVCDGGPGIPKEHQALVFEKFYRAPGERSQGKGLGLYIARQIVQGHGGAIGVESEPGHGTTFWFTLPLAVTRTTPGSPPAPAPTPE
jgi:signal transduction histidine kinase